MPQHHEVGAAAKGLGHVTRAGAAAVADDLATEAVSRIGTLYDGGELGIADPGLDPVVQTEPAYADLDDVGAGEDQLFDHLAGDHVARQDDVVRTGLADLAQELDEVLGVTVRDVHADEAQGFLTWRGSGGSW